MRKKLKEYQVRLKKALKEQDYRCTAWPNGTFTITWKPCCIAHDYACADANAKESESDRLIGDRKLRNCANKSFPLMGELMYIGIRSFLNTRRILFKKPMY